MNDQTKNLIDILFSAIQLVVLIIGALIAYFRLWREEPLKPRIEFDIDCQFLGVQTNQRVIMLVLRACNKGSVEHTFERISLKIGGIKSGVPLEIRDDKRLFFPEKLLEAEAIPKKYGYFFVRPGVNQEITFTSMIPADIRLIRVWTAFRYQGDIEQQTAEKSFEVISGS